MELDEKELLRRIAIINESSEGILPYHEVFYIHSILYSAERSLAAFNTYEKLLTKNGKAATLISIIQEAIGHAAALSRYFWISGLGYKYPKELIKLRKKRAKKLREKFGLKDDSPLKDRTLRDAWEHYDEKLDIFLIVNDIGFFFPDPLLNDYKIGDESVGRIFKLLNIDAQCLILLGKKYYFNKIKDEVLKIYKTALIADENGGRL